MPARRSSNSTHPVRYLLREPAKPPTEVINDPRSLCVYFGSALLDDLIQYVAERRGRGLAPRPLTVYTVMRDHDEFVVRDTQGECVDPVNDIVSLLERYLDYNIPRALSSFVTTEYVRQQLDQV